MVVGFIAACVLLALVCPYPWAQYSYLSCHCSTTWLKPQKGRIISVVPILGEVGWLDDSDPFDHLELEISFNGDSTCTAIQTNRRYYNRNTAAIEASKLVGQSTTVIQSYWRPSACFDPIIADKYFNDNFSGSYTIWIAGLLNIIVAGCLSVSVCFPNANCYEIKSRPTVAERLWERYKPYFPLIMTCLLSAGIIWLVARLLKSPVRDVLTFSPRFSRKERGQVKTAVAVLKQMDWFTVGIDDPKAEYYILESIVSETSPTICNIERDKLVFYHQSEAVAHAARRVGQGIIVWRNWWDPTICCDRDNSDRHCLECRYAWCFIILVAMVAPCLLLEAWGQAGCWGCRENARAEEYYRNYYHNQPVAKLTLSDKYAWFQARSVMPKRRSGRYQRRDIEALKHK